MSNGQKVLVIAVFFIGLGFLFFSKELAFIVGCVYSVLAAFWSGAIMGMLHKEGNAITYRKFLFVGSRLVPLLGFILFLVFNSYIVSSDWGLSVMYDIVFGLLLLAMFWLTKIWTAATYTLECPDENG